MRDPTVRAEQTVNWADVRVEMTVDWAHKMFALLVAHGAFRKHRNDPAVRGGAMMTRQDRRDVLMVLLSDCDDVTGLFSPADLTEPEEALRRSALNWITRLRRGSIPEAERELICRRMLSRPQPKGRLTYARRNRLIAIVVEQITKRGFAPTRNDATREKEARGKPADQSACSIVTKALARLGVDMNERSIEDIWDAHRVR